MLSRSQIFIVILILRLRPLCAFAQDPNDPSERARSAQEERMRQAQQQRIDAEMKKDRDDSIQKMKELMADTRADMAAKVELAERTRERLLQQQREHFQDEFESFKLATKDLDVALSAKAALKEPAQRIDKNTVVFLDFIRKINKAPVNFDSSEFRDFTPKELGRETLTTAERVTPSLAALLVTENQDTVDIHFLDSLSKLQLELRRLQWMAQKLKQSR